MAEKMRSPLGQAYGLGSARDGAKEWWSMRLTSLALIPLTLWFVVSVIGNIGADYETFAAWIGSPIPAILMIITIAVTFHHAAHGLQVVIEDYVHTTGFGIALQIAVKFACFLGAAAGVLAVIRVALGS